MAKDFWFKFYFKDWADDVKKLSLVSRGLLIELIIELNKGNGQLKLDIELISRLSGGLTKEIEFAIAEFRRDGIFDFEFIDGQEFIISRKIKKRNHKSLIAKTNGSKGGNPALSTGQLRLTELDNPTVNQTTNQNPNQTPIFNSIFISNTDSSKEGGMGETKNDDHPDYPFLNREDDEDSLPVNSSYQITHLEKFKGNTQDIELAMKVIRGYGKKIDRDGIIKFAELHDSIHSLQFPNGSYSKWRQYLGYYLEKQANAKVDNLKINEKPVATVVLDPRLSQAKKPRK